MMEIYGLGGNCGISENQWLQLEVWPMRSKIEIPIIEQFQSIFDFTRHATVPDDWFVFISDIRGSTKAFESGRYKDVNIIGASSIIAVLNAAEDLEIPYIFGGDGATFLIPPQLKEKTSQALLATQQLARSAFDMDLRIGIVPVAELYAKGHQLKVARFRISECFTQAVISGNGLVAAEYLVKDPELGKTYALEANVDPVGNYTGLECRWLPVKSQNGEIVSLIVMSILHDPQEAQQCYREVIKTIEEIYGSKDSYRPVSENGLKLSNNINDYLGESKVRTFPGKSRLLYQIVAYCVTRVADLAWNVFGMSFGKIYKRELVANCDYRKFDGVLRMVLDGAPHQRERLQFFLEQKFKKNEIVYGIHNSDHALLTCLIFDRSQKHLHLVDGGDGGYTLAAKKMKAAMKNKASQ